MADPDISSAYWDRGDQLARERVAAETAARRGVVEPPEDLARRLVARIDDLYGQLARAEGARDRLSRELNDARMRPVVAPTGYALMAVVEVRRLQAARDYVGKLAARLGVDNPGVATIGDQHEMARVGEASLAEVERLHVIKQAAVSYAAGLALGEGSSDPAICAGIRHAHDRLVDLATPGGEV